MDGSVSALAVSGNDLYATGYFSTAGGVAANGIAKWDGSSWSALGSGVGSGFVGSPVAVSGSNVYVGVGLLGVPKWDGSCWTTLGSAGVHHTVLSPAGPGLHPA